MKYEIPKRIKAKPTIGGLEMKELLILLVGFISIFTFLREMVHGLFVIPFMIMAGGLLLWLVMPARNNPNLRNYMSLLLFFKRDKNTYHAIDHHTFTNKDVILKMQKEVE